MSTVSQPKSIVAPAQASRNHRWLVAAISPILIAPVWLALPQQWLGPLQSLSGLLLVLLLTSAAATDLSRRKIFNWATYTALGWALAINALPGLNVLGSIGLSNCLYGAAGCFAIMLIPYSLARGGAGDVKLATAIGALVGIDSGLLVIAFAYIIAAAAIAGWTLWTKGPFRLLLAMIRRLGARLLPQYVNAPTQQEAMLLDQPIPLAGFFAIAALLVVFDAPAMLRSL